MAQVCEECNRFSNEAETLPCGHSFCRRCVQEMISAGQPVNRADTCTAEVRCPRCSVRTPVVSVGPFFPPSVVTPVEDGGRIEVLDVQLPKCAIHHNRTQELFCRTCRELMCTKCMLASHEDHKYMDSEDLLREEVSSARGLAADITQRKQAVRSEDTLLRQAIRDAFEDTQRLLVQRQDVLLAQVDEHTAQRLASLSEVESRLQESLESLSTTTVGPDGTVCQLRTPASSSTLFQHSVRNCMECIEEARNFLLLFQDPSLLFVPVRQQSRDNLLGFLSMLEEEGSAGNVRMKEPAPKPGTDKVEIHATNTQQGHDKGKREIHAHQPLKNRRITSLPIPLSAILDESTLRLSKPPMHTRQPDHIISLAKSNAAGICPCGLTGGATDCIIVSDIHRPSVSVLASTGKVIANIEDSRNVLHKLRSPVALAHSNEDLYILESANKRILKYSRGKFSQKFERNMQKGATELGQPLGIAVAWDHLYITDADKRCFHIFDQQGKYKLTNNSADLKFPTGIAVDQEGNVFVSDRDNHCVYMIGPSGKVCKTLGRKGSRAGELLSPYGVAVMASGLIVVSEIANSRLSIFSPSGNIVMCFGSKGSEPGQFNQPRQVYVNAKDQILVADELNQRLQVFEVESHS